MTDINKLFTELDPQVRAIVRAKVGGINDADLDEAVGHAWKEFAQHQPDEANLKTWLVNAAYWEALKQIRTRVERKPTEPIIDDPADPAFNPEALPLAENADPQEWAEAREQLREGMERVAELPERQRRVWLRRNYLGETPEQICEAEGITERAYRKAIERANRHMRGE